jgi:hypothetical protein
MDLTWALAANSGGGGNVRDSFRTLVMVEAGEDIGTILLEKLL